MGLMLTEWNLKLADVSKALGASVPNIDDDSGQLFILTEDTADSPSLYSDRNGTAISETAGVAIISFSNGVAKFFTADTVTAVDVSGITADGRSVNFNSMTPNQHVVPINPLNAHHLMAIPFQHSNAAETDTGLDLPANLLIGPADVKVNVKAIDATETIDLGLLSSETGGDANGFITLADVGTLGFVESFPVATGGTNIDFTAATTIGALLCSAVTGSDAVATNGGFMPKMYRTDGVAKSVTYTGSAGSDTARGYLYLGWRKMPF